VTRLPATVEAVASDRRSGAREIARAAAEALAGLDPEVVPGAVRALLRAHPAMAPLWRLATAVLEAEDPATGASRFLELLRRDDGVPRVAAPLLPDAVLTISWSSTVVAALRLRRPRTVLCMVSEPGGEGRRTAEALADLGARALPDEEALAAFPAGAAVVGADAVGPGGLVNKVRTGALCRAARGRGLPAIALAGETKLVSADLPAPGPFERVPLGLLDAVVLPDGPVGPDEAARRARAVPLHPSLPPLLEELGGAHPG
jgi:translation initiation factor 2B subunit (eIF-2B alpha/beta/delta family)